MGIVKMSNRDPNKNATVRTTNRRIIDNLKVTGLVEDLIREIEEKEEGLTDLANESATIGILNKVEINRNINIYLSHLLSQTDKIRTINDKLFDSISKKKQLASPKDLMRLYLENRRLENEHLKLLTEFCNLQQFQLENAEREILIVYRSLPEHLQSLLYRTIMEFIRKCPAIQKIITQKLQENEE